MHRNQSHNKTVNADNDLLNQTANGPIGSSVNCADNITEDVCTSSIPTEPLNEGVYNEDPSYAVVKKKYPIDMTNTDLNSEVPPASVLSTSLFPMYSKVNKTKVIGKSGTDDSSARNLTDEYPYSVVHRSKGKNTGKSGTDDSSARSMIDDYPYSVVHKSKGNYTNPELFTSKQTVIMNRPIRSNDLRIPNNESSSK
ncbi:uncharacterized protein LOC127832074 isoform X1 [Dreissena polymorpha]|nr:uncharacterized protein LOC127832074 isoform X1 [Dreissena polymorpha]